MLAGVGSKEAIVGKEAAGSQATAPGPAPSAAEPTLCAARVCRRPFHSAVLAGGGDGTASLLLLKTDGGNAWMEASRITAFLRGFHCAAAATSGEHPGRGLSRDEQAEANQTRCGVGEVIQFGILNRAGRGVCYLHHVHDRRGLMFPDPRPHPAPACRLPLLQICNGGRAEAARRHPQAELCV